MEIKWLVNEENPKNLKQFLKYQEVSKKILTKVKFKGGGLYVNHLPVKVSKELQTNDLVTMTLPPEEGNRNLAASQPNLNIIFEDDHYLIVNKPYNVVSAPTPIHKEDTMVNQVKGYIIEQGYPYKSVHLVTRLDKDTSGVMIFAKHSYAHSMMDKFLKEKKIDKYYIALVSGRIPKEHDIIDRPIRRKQGSIIEREVGVGGKKAQTEYWVEEIIGDITKVRVKLLTGRTHQIRVHFSHLDFPLVGDDLYGATSKYICRQALHCISCSFLHPITRNKVQLTAPIPEDIWNVIEEKRSEVFG